MTTRIFICFIFCAVLVCVNCFGQKPDSLNNRLALAPPMGWSSWNTFKKNPTEDVIRQTADAIVATGLKKAGYTYINIDDFWCTGRDDKGRMIVDFAKC